MGGIIYLACLVASLGLAGYAGYSNLQWYFVFIASLIMAICYFIIRAPQIYGFISRDGVGVIPKLLISQIILFSIITAPVYYIATLLS